MGHGTMVNDCDASGIEGTSRFLHRVWGLGLSERGASGARDAELDRMVQRTIKKVTEDLEAYHFNTAIAAMMELSTAIFHASGPSRDDATDALVILLAPFAPHITEELWQRRGGAGSVHQHRLPPWAPAAARDVTATVFVQLNGKVRDRLDLPSHLSADTLPLPPPATREARPPLLHLPAP